MPCIFLFQIKGNKDFNDTLFKKMDAVRDKQERIARTHFEQDARLTEAK